MTETRKTFGSKLIVCRNKQYKSMSNTLFQVLDLTGGGSFRGEENHRLKTWKVVEQCSVILKYLQ